MSEPENDGSNPRQHAEVPEVPFDAEDGGRGVSSWADRLLVEINKVFIGQDRLVRGVLSALLADGHVLIESVPGLGKTLLVRALGRVLGCAFNRIQFTPDLMPSDVTGSPVYDERIHDFRFRPGPVFTQLLLADEINRAPAKTHSALLEIMQESRVTIDGVNHPIERPFLVHGDAEPDRVGGDVQPARGPARPLPVQARGRLPERRRGDRTSSGCTPAGSGPDRGLTDDARDRDRPRRRCWRCSGAAPRCWSTTTCSATSRPWCAKTRRVADVLARAPRRGRAWRSSAAPRAVAALEGRDYAVPDDVQEVVLPALRHRVMLTPEAEVEGRGADELLTELVRSVEVPLR